MIYAGARLLLYAARGLTLSSDSLFDFHIEMWLISAFLKNIGRVAEIQNNFASHHLQNDFYCRNNLNQMIEVLLFYFDLLLI